MSLVKKCIAALIVVQLVALTACTKLNSGVGGMFNFDTDLKIVFTVDDHINPNEKQNASPVFVRLYELKSDEAFKQADFYAIYENDKAALGDAILAKRELKRFAPGQDREEKFVVDPQTRHVALFAEFFDYQDAKYKVVFPVTSKNIVRNTVHIEISGNQLLLKSAK